MRDEQAVARLFADLAPLWQALHRRLSTGRPVLRVKVGPLDIRQQTAFADLFGLSRLPGEYRTVSVADVDAVLSEVSGTDSYTVVEHLVGPVGNRAADRAAEVTARQQLWAWLSAHDVVRAQPVLEEWVTSMRRTGLMARSVEYTRSELELALRVLRELPGAGVPLPVFAARVLGDPHALDDGTRLQAKVVRALATLYDSELPTDAIQLRALWERAGLADDELSSTVLVAGSPTGSTDGVVGEILRTCASRGLAAVLTLQQIRCQPQPAEAAGLVWIVENPSILAMALGRFGDRCPPIICTAGWPSSACVQLLERLAGAGSELRYHGDLDGEGLRIAANIVARFGAMPWRMTSADYLSAVGASGPAVGRVTPVPWDGDLSEHLRRTGLAVPEERVVDRLLMDIQP
ncbi:TIGR02679 family protein [Nocardia abscessus]|uniref:TIGR02679 family protein n=1 Tax=Nocardia abscessus TaxID=120957 RepID=UPI002458D27D|nr:TIGR02679 family protein [Nocardia abscessus]